jgi:hypothetical protein
MPTSTKTKKIIIITNPQLQKYMIKLGQKCLSGLIGNRGGIDSSIVSEEFSTIDLDKFHENSEYFNGERGDESKAYNWKRLTDAGKTALAECPLFIITSKETLDKISFRDLIKSNTDHHSANKIYFLITPDLIWNNEVDQGYEYALTIINDLPNTINPPQFRFISMVPFEVLLDRSSIKHRKMVEAFPFFDLLLPIDQLTEILLDEYSLVHYKFIERTVLSDKGYLDFLLHDVNSLLTNEREIKINKRIKHLIVVANELLYSMNYRTEEDNVGVVLNGDESQREIKNTLNRVKEILVHSLILMGDPERIKKSNYSALIIEDDPETRKFLFEIISPYFQHVDVINELEEHSFAQTLQKTFFASNKGSGHYTKYDILDYKVVFLDLLILNNNKNWSYLNGLDIYSYVQKVSPYTVVPIITGLPRGSVSSLFKEVTKNGLSSDLVFTKSDGLHVLKSQLRERMSSIIKVCIEMEDIQDKLENKAKIPKLGRFKKSSHRFSLYRYIWSKDKEESMVNTFKKYVDNAVRRVEKLGKPLTESITSKEWSGAIPKKRRNDNFEDFWMALDPIITYRLAILDHCAHYCYYDENNYSFKITLDGKEDSSVDKFDDFLKKLGIREFSKNLFQTSLGFHFSVVKDDTTWNNKKDVRTIEYRITTENLFPHENKYLSDLFIKNGSNSVAKESPLNELALEWIDEFKNKLKEEKIKQIPDIKIEELCIEDFNSLDDLLNKTLIGLKNKNKSDYENLGTVLSDMTIGSRKYQTQLKDIFHTDIIDKFQEIDKIIYAD